MRCEATIKTLVTLLLKVPFLLCMLAILLTLLPLAAAVGVLGKIVALLRGIVETSADGASILAEEVIRA